MRMHVSVPRRFSRAGRRFAGSVLVAATAFAAPASAYVVVTADNQIYEVPTKPTIQGDQVFFSLDGIPVSLRIYDVNLRKTNELNYQLDQGATRADLAHAMRSLGEAASVDERIIVSSRLMQVPGDSLAADVPSYKLVRGDLPPSPSFSSDSPGPRQWIARRGRYHVGPDEPGPMSFTDPPGAPQMGYGQPAMTQPPVRPTPSPFEAEVRQAMADAGRQVPGATPRPYDDYSTPAAPMNPQAGKIADLDSQIAQEQAYLRQLTAGEVVVDDLDREIGRSMDNVKKLQKRRNALARKSDAAMARQPATAAPQAQYAGTYPPGSREAKWEQQLAAARQRLERLRRQQESLPPGSGQERELTDELIGETQYQIERLEKKLLRGR